MLSSPVFLLIATLAALFAGFFAGRRAALLRRPPLPAGPPALPALPAPIAVTEPRRPGPEGTGTGTGGSAALTEPPSSQLPTDAGAAELSRARAEVEIASRRADDLARSLAETRARGAELVEALHRAEEAAGAARAEKDAYLAEVRSLRRERDHEAAAAAEARRAHKPAPAAAERESTKRANGAWWCQECGRGGTTRDRGCPHFA